MQKNDYIKIFETLNLDQTNFFKSKSSFNNSVYLNENLILKVFDMNTKRQSKKYSSSDDLQRYNKEVYVYKNMNGKMISKLLSNGIVDGVPYILLKKGEGKRIYEVWHLLDDFKREKIIKQVSEFFDVMFNLISEKEIFNNNFNIDIKNSLNNNIRILEDSIDQKLKEDILSFIKVNLHLLDDDANSLCYIDMHFDNILIDNDCNITTIFDFEDIKNGPKYCVLDTLIRMEKYPYLYANEFDENNVKLEDYNKITIWLKKYNPNIFSYKDLEKKMKLISLEYDIRQLADYLNNEGLINRIIEDIN